MDSDNLTQIFHPIVADNAFWIAIVGLIGVVIGSLIAVVGNIALHWYQDGPRRRAEKARKALLILMLRDDRFAEHWRKLTTLARVTGASEIETKQLLVTIGARGSENDDGLWGLIEFHPFNKTDQ